MIIAKNSNSHQQGLGKRFRETGAGKLFGRLFGFAKKIPGIGSLIAEAGDILIEAIDLIAGDNFSRIADDSLTTSEQAILTAWDNTKFTPFYLALMTELRDAFVAGQTIQQQLVKLNLVLNKVCAARLHLNLTGESGLSQNAIAVRNEYINTSFRLTQETINRLIAQVQGQVSTFSQKRATSELNLQPLISKHASSSYTCTNYMLSKEIPASTTDNSGGSTAPIVLPTTGDTASAGQSTTTVSYPIYKKPLFWVAAAAVVAVMMKGKKKSKSNS